MLLILVAVVIVWVRKNFSVNSIRSLACLFFLSSPGGGGGCDCSLWPLDEGEVKVTTY